MSKLILSFNRDGIEIHEKIRSWLGFRSIVPIRIEHENEDGSINQKWLHEVYKKGENWNKLPDVIVEPPLFLEHMLIFNYQKLNMKIFSKGWQFNIDDGSRIIFQIAAEGVGADRKVGYIVVPGNLKAFRETVSDNYGSEFYSAYLQIINDMAAFLPKDLSFYIKEEIKDGLSLPVYA